MERPPEYVAPVERIRVRASVLFPTIALVALIAGTMPSFSLSANLLVLCTGGAMLWLGTASIVPRSRPPSRLPVSAAVWIIPFGLLLVVESVTFLLGSDDVHPTLSRLADPVLDHYLPRSALFFAWVSGFWGLVRR
jgi:hypothetical protein